MICGNARDRQIVSRDHLEQPAVYDAADERWLSYTDLLMAVRDLAQHLRLGKVRSSSDRSLIFCFARNSLSSLTAYLTAVEYGHAACLLDANLQPETKLSLTQTYKPELVIDESCQIVESIWSADYTRMYRDLPWWKRQKTDEPGSYMPPLHRELTLLLPKADNAESSPLVRLSFAAVVSNARSVAYALNLNHTERAITSLPLYCSSGLSVISSHLQMGASIVLTDAVPFSANYWQLLEQQSCTSIATPPDNRELLRRVELPEIDLQPLRVLTQTSRAPDNAMLEQIYASTQQRGGNLYVTYGQAEATARITVLPPERFPEKRGSVGIPIPWGEILIQKEDGTLTKEPFVNGQIIYRGPNVMLGYAQTREDLAFGDCQHGQINTGDIGQLDDEGFLYILNR